MVLEVYGLPAEESIQGEDGGHEPLLLSEV